MTNILLSSAGAQATILPQRGALISSLRLGGQNHDVFWLPQGFDATASSWPGGGLPFLFPFAGRVWHQGELYRYKVGQRVYHMPLHGFSWATTWSVVEIHRDHATLELCDDENSQGIFPFKFLVRMNVALHPTALKMNVQITHKGPLADAPTMPVAIGWHPYLSLSAGSHQLAVPARVIHPVTAQGGAGKPLAAQNTLGPGPWSLPHEQLKSLIFSELERPEAQFTLSGGSQNPKDPNHRPTITISAGHPNTMRHIVTWTNEPDSFHCVEPWMSLPDAVATPTGCQWLRAGESMEAWLQISL